MDIIEKVFKNKEELRKGKVKKKRASFKSIIERHWDTAVVMESIIFLFSPIIT